VNAYKNKVPTIIEKFSPNDVFNADETGLFFRATPTRSLIQRGESTKGTKQSKDRLSILLACSMTGKFRIVFAVNKLFSYLKYLQIFCKNMIDLGIFV